ncbi:MAG: FeoB-associated Cys-rich membrane protein [Bacteroidales bacterium]|nr:FeoB-associated Cys-rich membrane protein [Candidatus Physcousia equi]
MLEDMNLQSILLLTAIVALFLAALIRYRRHRGGCSGCSGCSGGCCCQDFRKDGQPACPTKKKQRPHVTHP